MVRYCGKILVYTPITLNASNYIKIHYSKESIFSNYFEILISLHVDLLNYLFEKQIFSGVREQITVSVAACRICGGGGGSAGGFAWRWREKNSEKKILPRQLIIDRTELA
jgi:hypothetical protein